MSRVLQNVYSDVDAKHNYLHVDVGSTTKQILRYSRCTSLHNLEILRIDAVMECNSLGGCFTDFLTNRKLLILVKVKHGNNEHIQNIKHQDLYFVRECL